MMDYLYEAGPVFSYKLRYIVGFRLVEIGRPRTVARENCYQTFSEANQRFWIDSHLLLMFFIVYPVFL